VDDLLLPGLIAAAVVGILSVLVIRRRQEREAHPPESPFAASTEGEKRCPSCGMGNLWTETRCVACGARLAG
jgi:hypothetical protein